MLTTFWILSSASVNLRQVWVIIYTSNIMSFIVVKNKCLKLLWLLWAIITKSISHLTQNVWSHLIFTSVTSSLGVQNPSVIGDSGTLSIIITLVLMIALSLNVCIIQNLYVFYNPQQSPCLKRSQYLSSFKDTMMAYFY